MTTGRPRSSTRRAPRSVPSWPRRSGALRAWAGPLLVLGWTLLFAIALAIGGDVSTTAVVTIWLVGVSVPAIVACAEWWVARRRPGGRRSLT